MHSPPRVVKTLCSLDGNVMKKWEDFSDPEERDNLRGCSMVMGTSIFGDLVLACCFQAFLLKCCLTFNLLYLVICEDYKIKIGR